MRVPIIFVIVTNVFVTKATAIFVLIMVIMMILITFHKRCIYPMEET